MIKSNHRKAMLAIGWLVVLLISIGYCLPGHPSVRQAGGDALAHVLLFGAIGAWFGGVARSTWAFVPLTAVAVLLEIVQWHIGGYAHIEYGDIAANVAGLALALVVTWLVRLGSRRDS